ncbi:MAG: hypothetical protein QOJ29_1240, partial [Thermoleophilaceae bacterium]|nr:hypothetical protein [Thermoleophilaceae bacterium]
MIAVFVCVPSGHEPAPGVLDAIGQARVIAAGTVWAARQKALDACDSEVLAFVDGDVVVGSGWRERLTSAWAHASQEIAAIGGPIQGSGRAVADLIDLGGRQLDQDPLERTLLGGNLSFRRSALAGVGGFGPTVDERDARDWFAEEHEAQRQLGHWGWLVRYDPALAAQRVDWDGAPRAGRFRYGVRMGIARRRPQALALRTAVMAAAGVAAAVLMRRSGLRRQRTARAAENLGVLLAPLVDSSAFRRRGSARPQPGRPTAALVRGRSRSRNAAPIILLYHRIADGELDPLGLCVSPRHFEDQLTALTDAGDILGMDELAAEHAAGRLPTGVTCVTFDDGYADNVDALTGLGIPVTLFAATGHIASGDPFFWDEAAALILSPGARPARISISTERGALAA